MKSRTTELATLYELSNTISYTSDFPQLLKLAMESLLKVIDYDICSTLLLNANTAHIFVKPIYTQSMQYVDRVKDGLLKEASSFCNEDIREKEIEVAVLPIDPDAQPDDMRPFTTELKSSFYAPFLVKGKIIGMINLSSSQENIFSEDEAKFVNTVANQVSNAIEHLQAMISAEKSKMESMVEGMREGAIMLDDKGNIIVLNPRARDMMGFDPEDEVSSTDLYEQMKLVNLDVTLEECSRKDEIITREVIMPHNEWRILNCDVSPVKTRKERVGTAIIFRDITREKEVDSMKTEFISTVSHELRTPLSITKEGLSLVLDKVAGDITEKQEMILSTAKENMDRLGRLINNVLDISKIEAGKMVMKREQLNIVQLAEDVASTFEMKVNEKGLDLHVRFPKKVIDVFADRDKTIQVFMNLINNAIKFTPFGHIELSGKIKGGNVECTVADTGIGISKNDLSRTFDKFQQFGRTPGSGEKGTGLGLSIAKGIIEMHNGSIRVESELEVGTKFIFTLPKFVPGLPLREFIDDNIRIVQRSHGRMCLVALTMSEGKNLKEPFSDVQRKSYLENIENVVKNDLHREGDAVFRGSKGCFVVLMNCNSECGGGVCLRLQNTLHGYLDGNQLADKVVLKMKHAAYPDDASDSEGLLKKINTI